MNDRTETQEKLASPTAPGATLDPKKEESISPQKKVKKHSEGVGTGRGKKSNPSFLEIRQEALEALIKLPEEGRFHLSYQTPEGEEKAINYWI